MSTPIDYKIDIKYPTTLEYTSYENILVTDQQLEAIRFIMNTLSLGILKSLGSISALGNKAPILATLHPLKNLAIIIADDNLREKYNTIYNKFRFDLIKSNFFGKFSKALQAPVWRPTLLKPEFLDGFAQEIHKDRDRLKSLIEDGLNNNQWDDFFKELGK
ncbi:MAG: hypothetical protein WCT85_02310 [Parachlamydiales bacterium]|jgi:hypothetical protein